MHRALAVAWAAPYTGLGLLAGLAMLAAGGRVRIMRRTLEFSGGRLGVGMTRLPQRCPFSAITLGHVILGVDAHALNSLRDHEQVHVAQYERWGVFFVPAYLLSSAWQICCGRCAYRDNYFEKQAYAIGGTTPASGGPVQTSTTLAVQTAQAAHAVQADRTGQRAQAVRWTSGQTSRR